MTRLAPFYAACSLLLFCHVTYWHDGCGDQWGSIDARSLAALLAGRLAGRSADGSKEGVMTDAYIYREWYAQFVPHTHCCKGSPHSSAHVTHHGSQQRALPRRGYHTFCRSLSDRDVRTEELWQGMRPGHGLTVDDDDGKLRAR